MFEDLSQQSLRRRLSAFCEAVRSDLSFRFFSGLASALAVLALVPGFSLYFSSIGGEPGPYIAHATYLLLFGAVCSVVGTALGLLAVTHDRRTRLPWLIPMALLSASLLLFLLAGVLSSRV